MICSRARNKTRPRIKASVFQGDEEVVKRTPSVSRLIPTCHMGDETKKSEINTRAETKKVNQISKGSTSAYAFFL
jgi:hypothetical protein